MGLLFSCKTTSHNKQLDSNTSVIITADEIIFEYHDASVPPDDHRSYFIQIREDSLFYSVDSYGEIIKKNSIAIDLKKWNSIKNAFVSCGIKNIEERKISEGCTGGTGNSISAYVKKERGIKNIEERKISEGCTGGTGNSISAYVKKEQLFEGYQYRCSNYFDGDLDGDLNGFLMTIKQDIDPVFFSTD